MDQLLNYLRLYNEILYMILLTMLLIFITYKYWNIISFIIVDWYYSLPFIGKIKKLSKNISVDNDAFQSERELFNYYRGRYEDISYDTDHYKKCSSYLRKACESGRRPLAWYFWLLLFILVLIEAMGFSYVLAGFTIPAASENLQKIGALGISFLLSVILVAFTHWSGNELYHNSLLSRTREQWKLHAKEGEKLLLSKSISLVDDYIDDEEPSWNQLLNRISSDGTTKRKIIMTFITAVLIVVIALGATFVRGKVLEREIADEHNSQASMNYKKSQNSFFPKIVTNQQAVTDNYQLNEHDDLTRQGGWGTFIVLAFIFIFLQLFGIFIGYKFGFAGKESKKAYNFIAGFINVKSYDDYFEKQKRIIENRCNVQLSRLQRLLRVGVNEEGNDNQQLVLIDNSSHRNFEFFYSESQNLKEEKAKIGMRNKKLQSNVSSRVKPKSSKPNVKNLIIRKSDNFNNDNE